MVVKNEVQCDYKWDLRLVDLFQLEECDTIIKVYVGNKRSAKQYAIDTGLEFKEALKNYFAKG